MDNYFKGNLFSTCATISPTIEKILRIVYEQLNGPAIDLYNKDNSIQVNKNFSSLLKDEKIQEFYGKYL